MRPPRVPRRFDPERHACLVADIRMPGLSGLELQQRLNEQRAGIPIIFITGHGDVPMAVNAMKAGAADFIQKPFRDQDLIDRITRRLRRTASAARSGRKRTRYARGSLADAAGERGHAPRRARASQQGRGSRRQPAHGGAASRAGDAQLKMRSLLSRRRCDPESGVASGQHRPRLERRAARPWSA